MTVKDSIAKAPSGRVRRTGLVRRQVLNTVGKEPGYEYRFVNDTGDRVSQLMEQGYEHVPKADVKVGDKRVELASPEGSVTQVSVGDGKKAFLMRIPKEFYDEDQKAKQDYVNRTEQATRKEALNGSDYGKLEISRS